MLNQAIQMQAYREIRSMDDMADAAARHLAHETEQHVMFRTAETLTGNELCGSLADALGGCLNGIKPVRLLGELDWRSHETLVVSLADAIEAVMDKAAPPSCRRPEARLRHLLQSRPAGSTHGLAFVLSIPKGALRRDMEGCFLHLAAQLRASVHSWVVVAPEEAVSFGETQSDATPLGFSFRTYKLALV